MKKLNKQLNNKKWFFGLILASLIAKLFSCIFKKRKDIGCNFKEFIKEEEKEVEELRTHKETFKRFCCNTNSIFQDYFIPSHNNDHKPKILRSRSLAIIAVLMVLMKLSVTGYLFFIYPNQAQMTEIITKKVLELTNQDRVDQNLNPLTLNSVLSASAMDKANDMINNNYFAHHSPTGKKPWDWIDRTNYAYLFVGENLAMNFTSAGAVHKALMQSPSHKKNIMNEKYQDIGLAMISGEIDGKKTNVLVELFAARTVSTVNLAVATPAETEPVVETAPAVNEEEISVLGIKEEQKSIEKVVEPAPAPKIELKEEVVKVEPKVESVKPVIKAEPKTEIKPEIDKPLVQKPVSVPLVPVTTTSMRDEIPSQEAPCEVGVCANPVSPNLELENNPTMQVTYITPEENKQLSFAAKLVKSTHYIYIGVLALMILALAANILIRITVQHKPVIIQTLLVILFISGLASVRLHLLENIVNQIAIL